MKRTIIVCGHGPGISDGVARRFGREGFAVALVARSAERVASAAAALVADGIDAKPFPCDLGDPAAVRRLIAEVRAALGPITVLHWNAYRGGAGDLTTATVDEIRSVLDLTVIGFVTAVQEALPDLKAEKGSVLSTGGGLAYDEPNVAAMAVSWGAMGLALGKAAQQKVAGLLHARLAGEGVYVGELVVLGSVKGTEFDRGNATLDGATVADRFWELHQTRTEPSATITAP